MKHFILSVILVLSLVSSAWCLGAETVSSAGFGDLTVEQQADVLKNIASMKAASVTAKTELSTAKQAEEWVDLGQKVGSALGGAARELGVAANDFVKTPVGKMAMFIIIWKFAGHSVVMVCAGFIILICGISVITYCMRRSNPSIVEYEASGRKIFGFELRTVKKRNKPAVDNILGWVLLYGCVLVASVILFANA